MSAFWPKWLGSSTTNPTGTYVADSVGTGWDASINSNVLRQTYINGFLDVSATSIFRYDVSLNGNLFIAPGKRSYFGGDVSLGNRLFVLQDISLNGNLIVNSDVSLNSRLFVWQDTSLNSNLFVKGKSVLNGDISLNSRLTVGQDISLNGNLVVNGDVSLNSRLFVWQDTSLNNNLFVKGKSVLNGDISLNGRLLVVQDASLNGNLFVKGNSIINGDISLNGNLVVFGNLRVQQVQNANIINTTVNNYQLIITEDISLNGRLLLQKDASFGGNLIINSAGTSGTGNVGIGIASPTYPLQIQNNINSSLASVSIFSSSNSYSARYHAYNGNGAAEWLWGIPSSANTYTISKLVSGVTTDYFTISTGGNVSIGTTSPAGALHIYEATGNTGAATNGSLTISHGNSGGSSSIIFPSKNNAGSDYGYIIYQEDTLQGGAGESGRLMIGTENDGGGGGGPADYLILQKNGGYVGIGTGTATPAYPLQVVGQIGATSFNATSDYRIKDNVKPLDETFTIDNIKPVSFTNKLLKRQDIGMIAHEVQEEYPYLVTGEKDGKDNQTVNYTGFIGILIHEVKQLKEQIKQMQSEIERLKANR